MLRALVRLSADFAYRAAHWERAGGNPHELHGFSNTRPLYLAGRNGTCEYIGLLDDVAVWDEQLSQGRARSIYTVPTHLGLDYNLDEMMVLFDVFDTGAPAAIGPLRWSRQTGLTGHSTGDAWESANMYYVQLDGAGAGVVSPVPSDSDGTVLIFR